MSLISGKTSSPTGSNIHSQRPIMTKVNEKIFYPRLGVRWKNSTWFVVTILFDKCYQISTSFFMITFASYVDSVEDFEMTFLDWLKVRYSLTDEISPNRRFDILIVRQEQKFGSKLPPVLRKH
jgi:hypothetical protein